jgi:hypothetical protein
MDKDLETIISDIHLLILEMESEELPDKSWVSRLGDIEGGLRDVQDRLCIGS